MGTDHDSDTELPRYASQRGAASNSGYNRYQDAGNSDDEGGCGKCMAGFIYFLSMFLIVITFPFSLCVIIKQVQVGWSNQKRNN